MTDHTCQSDIYNIYRISNNVLKEHIDNITTE